MTKILDIEKKEREASYYTIHESIERAELGIRAISIMYDEHSKDQNSKDNIFWQKNNIYYKLSGIRFQYKIFLEQLFKAERYLLEIFEKKPNHFNSFVMGNPYFERVERELSFIFDNIIFNAISIFDYLSHDICYICKANKQKTDYWSTLVKSARGRNNEISSLQIAPLILLVESEFVGKLNDYRSRLIHRKRDIHKFTANVKLGATDNHMSVRIMVSNELISKKYLKIIKDEHPEFDSITLTYTASWIINRTLFEIERILEGLMFEIKSNSFYWDNLNYKKKGKMFMMGTPNPITKRLIKLSDTMWWQYKGNNNLKWLYPNLPKKKK